MANPCRFCDANCCKSYMITATAFDILRAMERAGRPADGFAMLHQARLLAFDPDTTLDMEDDSWTYLLGFKSHPCAFLDKNRCTIHASAPLSCRRYPFQLDGKMNARFCPLPSQLIFRIRGADIKADMMKRELEAHKRIVKEWNAAPGRKADCMDFLLRRAREIIASGIV
ncbi:YkgJ family cysteine cluster protein [Candidatus Micrarchaeota archaeon]|nr:YkgJ family cysteine cluster protein [Candidatus Micrarchaeota archaeon]